MPKQYKTFRVFISSTFADMREERRILQKKVFPKLEKYCDSKGARFQAVDLRWGVTETSQLEQKTLDICLGEIKRCQQISPKPNFLVLLGDRYGWQPIPNKVPENEMQEIEKIIDKDDKYLLEKWYRLDENAVPSEFVLQARDNENIDFEIWLSTENKIRNVFRNAVSRLNFSEQQKNKYFCSATHLEILNGALNPPKDIDNPEKHVFVYSRSISGLPKNKDASDYMDFDEENPDEYCKKQINDLKGELKSKLKNNYNEYKAVWEENISKIESPNDFAEKVYTDLLTIIDEQIKETKIVDAIEQEIQLHKEFKDKLTDHFVGREDTIDKISTYINTPDDKNTFVLSGTSGSGKSSTIAKLIDIVEKENKNALVIYRFIGATSASSAIISLLQSICSQIIKAYKIDLEKILEENPNYSETDLSGLSQLFANCLTYSKPDKPIVICLDALDQLSAQDETISLFWLPKILKENVKIITTVLPELEPKLQDCIIEHLPLLPQNNAEKILNRWLKSINRKLTDKQQNEIINKFNQNGLPIFLKLAFEKAKEWKSYDVEYALQNDVSGIINDLMDSLEKEHTKDFVEHIVSYLLCGRYQGLTENELLEILVFDKDYWENKFLPQTHPVHRNELADVSKIPIVVWSRLYLDLEPFLTERDANGIPIISFFHRQFLKVLQERYLYSSELMKVYHQKLAGYFKELPLYLDDVSFKKTNIRKVDELPRLLINSELWDDVTETLCNLDFIQAKAAAKLTYDLLDDFNIAISTIPDNAENIRKEKERHERMEKYTRDLIACAKGEIPMDELEIPESITPFTEEQIDAEIERKMNNPTRADKLNAFTNFLGHEASVLQNYAHELPHLTNQQAWNYEADGPVGENVSIRDSKQFIACITRKPHTRPNWNPCPIVIKTLIAPPDIFNPIAITPEGRIAMAASSNKASMLWDLFRGKAIRAFFGHTYNVNSLAITPDGKMAVSGSWDKTCIVWDIETGNVLKTLTGHTDTVCSVAVTSNGIIAVTASSDNTCIVWNLETGKALKTLIGHNGSVESVAITTNGKMAVTASLDRTCIVWDLDSGKALKTLSGHTNWVKSIDITANGKMAISASWDRTCIVWDIKTGKALKTLTGHMHNLDSVAITPDGKMAVSGSWDKTCIVWDIEKGKVLKTLTGHSSLFIYVVITADGKEAVSACSDRTCVVWDLETGRNSKTYTGHTDQVLSVIVTPDMKSAITGSSDNNIIVWDIETGKALKTFSGHNSSVQSVSILPDGKRLVSASWDKTFIVWDMEKVKKLKTFSGHTKDVLFAVVTPNGKRMVSASSNKTGIVWDLETAKVIIKLIGHSKQVNYLVVTPDGKRAVSASSDKTCIVWDIETGKALKTLSGHSGCVDFVTLTPDGKIAVSASSDKTCIVWCLSTGKALRRFNGHTNGVTSVIVMADGSKVLSASWDKTCILWDLKTGQKLAHFFSKIAIRSVAWSRYGVCAGGASGEVFFLEIIDESLLCKKSAIITIRQISSAKKGNYQSASAYCPLCGHCFAPPTSVLETIEEISKKADLLPHQSPCLELPDEVWEHSGLVSPCPNCNTKLKYNPFIAGGN